MIVNLLKGEFLQKQFRKQLKFISEVFSTATLEIWILVN